MYLNVFSYELLALSLIVVLNLVSFFKCHVIHSVRLFGVTPHFEQMHVTEMELGTDGGGRKGGANERGGRV